MSKVRPKLPPLSIRFRLKRGFSILLMLIALGLGTFSLARTWLSIKPGKFKRIFEPLKFGEPVSTVLAHIQPGDDLFYYMLKRTRKSKHFVDFSLVALRYLLYPAPVYFLRDADLARADWLLYNTGIAVAVRAAIPRHRRFVVVVKARYVLMRFVSRDLPSKPRKRNGR